MELTQANPGREIAKRIVGGKPDEHVNAVWSLKNEYYLQEDAEFRAFLCSIKGRIKNVTIARGGHYPERMKRFAQCVLNATGFPLTRWIRPKRRGKKVRPKG